MITYTQKLAGANSQVYIATKVSTYQVHIVSPHWQSLYAVHMMP